jgi:Protein of unknown function (DUF2442)
MNPKAKVVFYESPYKLIVTFNNNQVKEFDMEPYLKYPVYQHLQNESLCMQATIENGIVVWDEETDLDPDRLYLESKSVTIAI